MEKKLTSIYWGLILIAGGGVMIAQTRGFLTHLSPAIWIAIFSVISFISLISYISTKARSWSILFPASIFGGLAILIGLAAKGGNHPAMAAPLMLGVAVPFIAAYFQDRIHNWWALIPTSIMVFITIVLLMVNNLSGELIGAGLFFLMAAAFLITCLKKQVSWAALVAYVFFVMGFLPLLAASPHPEMAGVLIFLAAALPFIRIFIKTPEKWWAVIPAGVLISIACAISIDLILNQFHQVTHPNLPTTLTLAGTGLTFGLIWLRLQKNWVAYAAVLFGLGAAAAFFVQNIMVYWPEMVILGGFLLLWVALRTLTA